MHRYDDETQWDAAPGDVVTMQRTLNRESSKVVAASSYYSSVSAYTNTSVYAGTSAADIDA